MLQLDITAALAKAITPSMGIPDQELTAIRTSMRRYVDDWLKEREKGQHPWSMDPYNKGAIDHVKRMLRAASALNIRTVLWIGIGGSGLGPKVIQEIFETPQTVEFIVLDSIDPAAIEMTLGLIDWKHALVIIASKSGETMEPMSLFFYCFEKLREANGQKAAEQVIAVTDPEHGVLRSFCLEQGIPMLSVPPDVGGRFSIFTPIGLLALGILEADIDQFVRGAKEMDTLCQKTSLDENPAAQLAAVQYLLDMKRSYSVRVIMPYSQRLASFARWDQQLIAESLGKTETQNPIPVAAMGTQDQHSLLQQWMQGPRTCWHIFIREIEKPRVYVPERVENSFKYIAGKTFGQLLDACYEGTSRALTAAKRPHVTISLQRLDEYHLGQLFFLFLAEVILLGKLYRIDPYGQPGVEAGKKITKEILSRGRTE